MYVLYVDIIIYTYITPGSYQLGPLVQRQLQAAVLTTSARGLKKYGRGTALQLGSRCWSMFSILL